MNKENKTYKNKNVLILVLLLIIMLIMIIVCGIAYAKYLSTATGSATAEVAEMVCTIIEEENRK